MIDSCLCSERVHVGSLFSPDVVLGERLSVESIRFSGDSDQFEVVELCGMRIKVWKPSGAVSDTTLHELDPEGTFPAMKKEIFGFTNLKVGKAISKLEADQFCREREISPISCRWVTVEKPEADEQVRSRIVVRDFAKAGQSARKEGISSPTPSTEAFRTLLSVACGAWGDHRSLPATGLDLALDVSQAFANSPLDSKVCIRLPMSVSTLDNEPVFMDVRRGLNSLRIGSLAWIKHFSGIVKEVGVQSGTVEPCLYVGVIDKSPILIVLYLLVAGSETVYKKLVAALSNKVRIREAGRIKSEGFLKFLGRTIRRVKGSPSLFLGVEDDYLSSCFEELGISKGSETLPDLRPMIEASVGEECLSADGHARYRRVLGRLARFVQTRQDLGILILWLASRQAKPTPSFEKALRATLRFIKTQLSVWQKFPSEELTSPIPCGLELYSDASYAPLRSNGRRSISGVVLSLDRRALKCFKCFSRHQSSVTVSSCEAELAALQAGVQDGLGIMKSLEFVLSSIFKSDVNLPMIVRTDSLSGKCFLRLRICRGEVVILRSKLSGYVSCWRGSLILQFVKGDENCPTTQKTGAPSPQMPTQCCIACQGTGLVTEKTNMMDELFKALKKKRKNNINNNS